MIGRDYLLAMKPRVVKRIRLGNFQGPNIELHVQSLRILHLRMPVGRRDWM